MKLKKLSILAGAVAVAFSITPLAVNAQVNSNAPQRVSQAKPQSPPDLKLSQKQIGEINEIRSDTRTKIQNVLTPKQREKIKTDLEAGKNARQVFASIQFSQQQQNELKNIMETSQRQMEGVLNATQKKTLNEWRNNLRSQQQKK
ncbi:MAG: P pilus assembly/Cpx signaling pathway, periplasmic inhibitor/zinc-resistance associated protein [Rivularia sp. (in: cyanobacteria)]